MHRKIETPQGPERQFRIGHGNREIAAMADQARAAYSRIAVSAVSAEAVDRASRIGTPL
jgi:hypothetical protein